MMVSSTIGIVPKWKTVIRRNRRRRESRFPATHPVEWRWEASFHPVLFAFKGCPAARLFSSCPYIAVKIGRMPNQSCWLHSVHCQRRFPIKKYLNTPKAIPTVKGRILLLRLPFWRWCAETHCLLRLQSHHIHCFTVRRRAFTR